MAVTMGEVFERAGDRQKRLMELEEIGFELLANCRLRKQIGPPQLRGLPSAPTVIENTHWIPWMGQGGGAWWLEYRGGNDAEDYEDNNGGTYVNGVFVPGGD
jgi:hypothetical protein